jgi:hypothetical protein
MNPLIPIGLELLSLNAACDNRVKTNERTIESVRPSVGGSPTKGFDGPIHRRLKL